MSVDVVVALRLEGGACGQDGVQGGQGVSLARVDLSLLQCRQPPCPRAQNTDTVGGGRETVKRGDCPCEVGGARGAHPRESTRSQSTVGEGMKGEPS